MKGNTRPIVILSCIFILAACTSFQVNPSPQPQQDMPPASTTEPAQSIFGPGTFSIDLPEGWDVASLEINSDPERPYTLFLLGENPAGNDGPGISQVVVADADLWTPKDFALSQCSTCPQNPLEEVNLGGRPALRTQIGGGGVPILVTWYFVENQGKFIALALHDPETLEPLEDVLASIQFE
jgi:hypothetical protein